MAERGEGGGLAEALLPGQVTLDAVGQSGSEEGKTLSGEMDASILGSILDMEGTAAELKEEESSIMEALAECGEALAEADEDYEEEEEEDDEEGDSDDDDDDDDDDGDEDEGEEEKDESGDEESAGKGLEEALDFGEMPDFSSMMEAEGAALLEGAVAAELGIKTEPDPDLMDINTAELKADNDADDKKTDDQTKKKRKRKRSQKEKTKQSKKTKREKKKRKKKKSGQDSKVDSKSLKASDRRRNIRKIIGEKDLDKETLDAQKEEFERQQRILELKRQAMNSMSAASSSKSASGTAASGSGSSTTSASASAKVQDPQLKSLLQSAEEEAEKIEKREEKKKPELIPASEIKKEVPDEEEEEKKEEKTSKAAVDVIELSSDSESNDDDCVMVPSSDEEEKDQVEEAEDLNDGGSHINDEMNCRDEEGRVLVNVGHPADDPDIFLAPQMARVIKPHQIGGVRFLYDNLVESLPRFNSSPGFGCILAHSMGLGKTIQVISFIDIFLRHTGAKKVLCIVPINTLQNWMAEFNMWAPPEYQPPPPQPPSKAKDGGKKAEKKPRERGKKGKEASMKTGGKGAKGKEASSVESGQNLMGNAELAPGMLGPLPAVIGEGHGGSLLNMQGMTPVGTMGGGYPASVGGSLGQMCGTNSFLGPMAGPPVGQNSHLDPQGNSMQGMHVSQMGNSGGSFQEMPWMSSSMGQPGGSPFGSVQLNPSMKMPALSNQSSFSGISANPFPGTEFKLGPSNSKDCAPYGSPLTPCHNLSSSGTINSSGPLTDMSSPAASNPIGSVGSLMEADRWTRADNSNSAMDGSSFTASCPSTLMDASMDPSDSASVGSLLGMSCGSPMSRLSSNSAVNGSQMPLGPTDESLMNKLPVEDSLERFMGPSLAGGDSGHISGGMGMGMAGSPSPLLSAVGVGNRMEGSPGGNPASAPSPFTQVNVGSPLAINPRNSPSAACTPPISSMASAADAQSLDERAKESVGSSGDAPAPSDIGAPSPSVNTDSSKDAGCLDKDQEGAEENPQSGATREGNVTDLGEAGPTKDTGTPNGEGQPSASEAQETEAKEVRYRNFRIFLLNDSCKATAQRAKIIAEWNETGGVLLMGYEMYRLLANRRSYTLQPKKRSRSKNCKQRMDVIDVDEEDKNKELLIDIYGALVNPGPELVICDEGHRIKNNHASISQALKQIRTRRRVVLTGYPLQNNLMEYWCMVDFVRPNFLGNKTEFSNMFERPIMNGQCQDSTAVDRKLMKHRAYVLHSLLSGFVQRRSHMVLQRSLPLKHEYVFLVRMSPIQRKLYRRYIDSLEDAASLLQASTNPLKAFSVGCKIWNHPDILHKSIVLKKPVVEDNDLDIDGGEGSGSKKKLTKTDSSSSLASMASSVSSMTMKSSASSMGLSSLTLDPPSPSGSSKAGLTGPDAEASLDAEGSGGTSTAVTGVATATDTATGSSQVDKKEDDHAWVSDAFEEYEEGELEHGPKMVLLSTIIDESLNAGDKILVFSQSLSTLDTIEEFLSKHKVPRPDMDENWVKNRSYFRLDGSTSGLERERLINEFNRPANKTVWVFLLSTKAGCLGINLIGANRAVVLDASWNPCHDCQAVCRIFRFGQNKECHVYRLVTENTLERNIYDRQITKQGMSDRVVDEINSENPFSRRQLQNLLKNEDKDFPYIDFSQCEEQYDDPVLINTLKKQGQWITKEPFYHESLLIDRKELRMTLKEKRQAKEGYARDKRMNVTYSRPSYAAYYPRGSGPSQMYIRRTPSYQGGIRPMMSTPPPRHGPTIIKPGVSVQQVITTTDIVLPGTNTASDSGSMDTSNKISAGQKILVIKTPKGVYIRTNDGKMFAVRSKGADDDKSDSDSPLSSMTPTGGTSTTTATSTTTTVSTGAGGGMSTTHPSYMFGPSGRGQGAMDRASYSLPPASRQIRNMYSMANPFSPAVRARGARPMIRPPFLPSGRGRSRPGDLGKAVKMRDSGFPFSEGSLMRRGGRGRGGVMGSFGMGGPSLHRSPGPYGYMHSMSNLPHKKGQSSTALPPFGKGPDLAGSSPMMKLLTSDDDREDGGGSGLMDRMSGGRDLDSFAGYQSSRDRTGQPGRDPDSGRDMEDDSDMDSDEAPEDGVNVAMRRDIADKRDTADVRRDADSGREVEGRGERAEAGGRDLERREVADMGKDADRRKIEDFIKHLDRGETMNIRKEMADFRKSVDSRRETFGPRRDADNQREPESREEMGDVRRNVDSKREMQDIRKELDSTKQMTGSERQGEDGRDMDDSRDMNDERGMDEGSDSSSAGSYSDDMMEHLMEMGNPRPPYPPEGWDMEGMEEDFSPSSSNSSFAEQMGMSLRPENSVPSSSDALPQKPSHSLMHHRRHINMMAGDDRQPTNILGNLPFFRDQEQLRSKSGVLGVKDRSVLQDSQPSRSMVQSPHSPQSMVRSPVPPQSMVRSPLPPQTMVQSPQAPQSMVRSPQAPQSMVRSPQAPQSMVRSPQTPQSMVHSPQLQQSVHSPHSSQSMVNSPLAHSPSSPHSPSPGPSSHRALPSASHRSQMMGNGQPRSLGDQAGMAGSSPVPDAASGGRSLPQSVSTPAASSFGSLPAQSSHPGQHFQQSARMPAWQPMQHGSHHQSQFRHGRGQDKRAFYARQRPSAAQPGHHRMPMWTDRERSELPKSLPASSHLESWDPSSPSNPSPTPGQVSQPHREPQQERGVVPGPQAEGSMSPSSASQGESPMSEEWMNSSDWFDEDVGLDPAGDRRQLEGQGEGDPATSTPPQSLSAFLADSANA